MRRLIALSIAFAFTASMLISCGDSSTGPDPNNGGETTTYNVTTSVSPSDAGSVSPSADGPYEEGESIELHADPNQQYRFINWSGDIDSTADNPLSLTVDQDYELTANFEKKTYSLTTNIEGEGEVAEEIVQQQSKDYEHGTVVELTANPADGYTFVEWTGDLTGTESPSEITVDEPKEVTAVFEKKSYSLTINTEGEGGVTEDVIQQKSKDYEHGTVVELTANPTEGYKFVEWTGDLSGTENPAQITVDNPKEVTAVFEKKNYALTTSIVGEGGITEEVVQQKSKDYEHDTVVELTANPADGWKFAEWNGALSGTENPKQITINKAKDVTAVFEKKSFALTINTNGSGSITKTPDQATYEYGTTVELEATPDDGQGFAEWTGDVTGSENPTQITVNEAKEVTAVFDETFKLTIETSGQGTVSKSPDQSSYTGGTVVELTPNPAEGYKFVEWTEDLSGTENPSQITIDDTKQVTAVFEKKSFALTVNTTGNGSVTKSPDQERYEYDTTVELEATPADSHQFVEWTGAITSTGNPVQITVDEEKDVTAIFEEKPSFYLASNGVTVKCEDASIGDTGTVNGVTYTKRSEDQITVSNAETSCTSGITDMSGMFTGDDTFNGDISSWDVSSVTNMSGMFFDATSFSGDISSWAVNNVTDMSEMFYEATAFNGDISSWDVSNVTDMSSMFERNDTFNQDLNGWNVSSVTDMSGMFTEAAAFNGDISSWIVSSVTEMGEMFSEATSFNTDISGWNVGNVTDMGDMFFSATSFNKDLSSWNVSSVTDMRSMFAEATSFNGNISGWNVSNVEFMSSMFENADAFNGNIGSWDVSKVTSMNSMFEDAASFNQNISNWCVSNIESEPGNFSDGSPLTTEHTPDWGTCPGS